MKMGIAGVGGIGSNVAAHLARLGWSWLRIVDFDRVERSNLNRQFYFVDQIGGYKVDMLRTNLLRLAPAMTVEAIRRRLTGDNLYRIFADCRVVVEGFDQAPLKKELLEAFAATDIPVISACGIAGTDLGGITVRSLGKDRIVGDFCSDCQAAPLYSPKVAVVAAMMADLVVEIGNERVNHG